jgi:hypothetical protein
MADSKLCKYVKYCKYVKFCGEATYHWKKLSHACQPRPPDNTFVTRICDVKQRKLHLWQHMFPLDRSCQSEGIGDCLVSEKGRLTANVERSVNGEDHLRRRTELGKSGETLTVTLLSSEKE